MSSPLSLVFGKKGKIGKAVLILSSILFCAIPQSWAVTQLNCTWDDNDGSLQDDPDLMIRLNGDLATAVFNNSFGSGSPDFSNLPGGSTINYRRSSEFSTAGTSVYLRVYSSNREFDVSQLPVLQIANVSRPDSSVQVKITESSTTQSADDLSFNCTQVQH